MDFKEILGDLYSDEIGTKLNESGIKFADLSKGEYVSKDKYETASNEAKTYKEKYENLTSSNKKESSDEVASLTAERDKYKKDYEDEFQKRTSIENGIKVTNAGVDDKYKKFVMSEVKEQVNDTTDFDTALKNYIEKNPQYKKVENARKVNSSFSISGPNKNASSNSAFNNAILGALGRK